MDKKKRTTRQMPYNIESKSKKPTKTDDLIKLVEPSTSQGLVPNRRITPNPDLEIDSNVIKKTNQRRRKNQNVDESPLELESKLDSNNEGIFDDESMKKRKLDKELIIKPQYTEEEYVEMIFKDLFEHNDNNSSLTVDIDTIAQELEISTSSLVDENSIVVNENLDIIHINDNAVDAIPNIYDPMAEGLDSNLNFKNKLHENSNSTAILPLVSRLEKHEVLSPSYAINYSTPMPVPLYTRQDEDSANTDTSNRIIDELVEQGNLTQNVSQVAIVGRKTKRGRSVLDTDHSDTDENFEHKKINLEHKTKNEILSQQKRKRNYDVDSDDSDTTLPKITKTTDNNEMLNSHKSKPISAQQHGVKQQKIYETQYYLIESDWEFGKKLYKTNNKIDKLYTYFPRAHLESKETLYQNLLALEREVIKQINNFDDTTKNSKPLIYLSNEKIQNVTEEHNKNKFVGENNEENIRDFLKRLSFDDFLIVLGKLKIEYDLYTNTTNINLENLLTKIRNQYEEDKEIPLPMIVYDAKDEMPASIIAELAHDILLIFTSALDIIEPSDKNYKKIYKEVPLDMISEFFKIFDRAIDN